MTPLQQMSYEEFGRLRFLDFFPKTDAYAEDHDGGMETGIGIACTEGYLWTMFASPMGISWQTSEMCLELGRDCPEAEGHALLDKLNLGLRRGMTNLQIEAILGVPDMDRTEHARWMRFVVGETHPFFVGCHLLKEGLHSVWICRKDLADMVVC